MLKRFAIFNQSSREGVINTCFPEHASNSCHILTKKNNTCACI